MKVVGETTEDDEFARRGLNEIAAAQSFEHREWSGGLIDAAQDRLEARDMIVRGCLIAASELLGREYATRGRDPEPRGGSGEE
jgi:hypothetical protein